MRRAAWLALFLSASASALAQKPAMWRLEEIATSPAAEVTLHKGPSRAQVGTLSASRARLIVSVKNRLEQQAGAAAELVLTEGNRPNAFSTPSSKAGPLVGLNLGMVELLGDDEDAYAAVLGHEYAHLALRHREARMARESVRLLGTTALAIALSQGMRHGAADVANVATQAVSTTFSREEERDADRWGLRYAAAAGFDPFGAVRAWELMAAAGERTVHFLSSHPAPAERVENMRALAAELAAASSPGPEVEHSFAGVRIHGVLIAESHFAFVVTEAPPGARTTLKPGDRLLGCYGDTPHLTPWSPASCRLPEGGYAFLVERGADQIAAVVLTPRRQ